MPVYQVYLLSYFSLVPQPVQKVAFGDAALPQFGQTGSAGGTGADRFVPHAVQNFIFAERIFPQFGQTFVSGAS